MSHIQNATTFTRTTTSNEQVPAWCILFDGVRTLDTGIRLRGRHKTFVFPEKVDDFGAIQTDDGSTDCHDVWSGAMYYIPKGVTLTLYSEVNQQGSRLPLTGEGELAFVDFSKVNFNDEALSLEWSAT